MTAIQKTITPKRIVLSEHHWDELIAAAEQLAPQEVCGLLLGYFEKDAVQVVEVRPVKNRLESTTRYQMEPQQQIQVFLEMEARGLQLAGIYHSHPNGPERPSATDIQEACYPETVYLILARNTVSWQINGFLIRDGETTPVSVERYKATG